ncbi:hypothetical protein [Phytohabitans houttuyneae]|uniref:hypothetical protein n=1 Tax=Phytohabitans houttuyneae TaxID=1076126 RepID=UPI001FEA1E36|nr:hypothetical protein [Phytohabitans houttuyneae]
MRLDRGLRQLVAGQGLVVGDHAGGGFAEQPPPLGQRQAGVLPGRPPQLAGTAFDRRGGGSVSAVTGGTIRPPATGRRTTS